MPLTSPAVQANTIGFIFRSSQHETATRLLNPERAEGFGLSGQFTPEGYSMATASMSGQVSASTSHREFVLRRLHSLSGIVPIGLFLLEHFFSNAAVLSKNPAQSYGDQVKFLNGLPFVLVLEIALIYIPLLFHGLYGLYIAKNGEPNSVRYSWLGNWGYTFQRISGIIVLAFIGWHVWTARFAGVSVPDNPYLAYDKMAQMMANPWIFLFFLVGITFTCYHFAYGLFLFAAKWGITVGNRARQKWGIVCWIIGIGLSYVGIASALAFRGILIYPVR